MQDRVPTHPGRVTLTPVSGQANTYDMVRADSPTQEGTPLNKNNLLKDSTAALYGLGSDAVPDEVLAKIPENFGVDGVFEVGDTLSTLRTDLGDKWLLCNGDVIPKSSLPELAHFSQGTNYGFCVINSSVAINTPGGGHKVYGKNQIILYTVGYIESTTTAYVYVIDCDTKTEKRYTITVPYSGHQLLGIDHNGTSWVTAWVNSSETIKIATMSDDFSTVQNEYSIDTGYKQYADNSLIITDFLFNGSHYYLATRYSGHTTILVNIFDSNFNLVTTDKTSPGNYMYSAYLFRFGPYVALGYSNTSYGFITLYTNGEEYTNILSGNSNYLYTSTDSSFYYVRYAIQITDTHYIFGGMYYGVTNKNLYIYNSSNNSATAVANTELGLPSGAKFGWIFYDSKKRACIIVARTSDSSTYYMLSIDYGQDPTIASNYTLETLTENPLLSEYSVYSACLDNSQTVWNRTDRSVIADSIQLPSISLDGVYTYIKAKE